MSEKNNLNIDTPVSAEFDNTKESVTMDDLVDVMKKAGFDKKIISHHRNCVSKDIQNSGKSPVEVLHRQYENIFFTFDDIQNYTPEKRFYDNVSGGYVDGLADVFLREDHAKKYLATMTNEFNQGRKSANESLTYLIEQEQDKLGNEITRHEYNRFEKEIIKPEKKELENTELYMNARFGYWLTDAMHDVFIIYPSQRENIQKFAKKRRKNILGNYAENKIIAGEELLEIINNIDDDVDNVEPYRDTFMYYTNEILRRYGKAYDEISMGKKYKIAAKIIEEKSTQDDVAMGVLDVQNTHNEEEVEDNTPHIENTSTTPPSPKPTREPKPTPPPKNTYDPKLVQEWEQQQKKEEAELAEIQRMLDEIEAEETTKTEIAEEEREVEDTVTKLYKRGEKVNFSDISQVNESDFETSDDDEAKKKQKELIRASRKLEVKEAAEYHGADKLVVLKAMNKRAEAETYMAVLESESCDDDVIILNNDSYGSAVYIGLRKNMNSAIELAEVRQKNNKKATDDDVLFYMMRNCRTEMKECGLEPITHNKTDVAVDIAMAIEDIRPPQGELKINHED